MTQEKENTMDRTTLAHAMYNAYGNKAEWKAFGGTAMPSWEELVEKSPHIVERWEAAADVAIALVASA